MATPTPLRRPLSDNIDALPDCVLQEWAPAIVPRWNKYLRHVDRLRGTTPTARQWAFLCLDSLEALYGGAAGGGKSDALLMAALQYVDVPGYAALLLRRTYADLEKPGALIPRSHEWLRGTDAHWTGRRWRFPSGAYLDFGYLDNDADRWNYQSSEYQFIGFDELTQFQESWYRYLFSRARRLSASAIPIRIRNATNPGGIGHDWVKQRFLVEGPQHGRVFIPSRLEDNPHLDKEEYERSLEELDPITRMQLRWGDWTVRPAGAFFKDADFKIEQPEDVPPDLDWIRQWDLAATKNQTSAFTAGSLSALHEGEMWIKDIRRIRGNPGEVESLVKQTAQWDGIDVEVWMEQEPGSGGVNTMHRYRTVILLGYNFNVYLPKHDKLTRAAPLSALAKAGGIHLVAGPSSSWIGPFLDEARAFPDGFRDQIDTLSASHQVLAQRPNYRIRGI